MRSSESCSRRTILRTMIGSALGTVMLRGDSGATWSQETTRQRTSFQLACMTLPYADFPLYRALTGIAKAGYSSVAWGTTHRETEGGERIPVMAADASPEKAKDLTKRCRDLGLEPIMMFSTVYPEADDGIRVLTQRIKQASAAGIGQILTFGHTQGGGRELWIERFRKLGPVARDHGVLIVVKQHGGSTGTGEACAWGSAPKVEIAIPGFTRFL